MRADRLVATLLFLQSRGRATVAEVAEELEVSTRTARRDLEALSMAGVPVYSQAGRGGGWSLVGGARTDLSGLSAPEARALFLVAGPGAATPEVKTALRANPRVAITNRRSVNQIFSFGRDHGYFGRIFSQTVIPLSTIAMPTPRKIVGFCYTPQDGNSLLSSVAATLRYLDPKKLEERIDVLRPYIFREI